MHDLNKTVSNSIFSILERNGLFRAFGSELAEGVEDGSIDRDIIQEVGNSVWKKTIKAANDAYKPGIFTTFAGYEFSSSVELYDKYLHRNVIFKDTKNLPERIFSRADSLDPEKLWDWMDGLRVSGVESLAIPHNSNISGGSAFSMNDYNGGPIDGAYVNQRLRNEPLVEITQAKGTSETHPFLSKNDEWANFEAKTNIEGENLISNLKGSYVRDAYLRGLIIEEKGLSNPFKFGVIGSSDTHVAGGSYTEETHFSKIGLLDGEPYLRGSVPFRGFYGFISKVFRPQTVSEIGGESYLNIGTRLIRFGSSGLAGVWAEENTRESEQAISKTFSLCSPSSSHPRFLVWAISDPLGAPLQRVQIIKGWLEEGEHREKVFDIACSDNANINPTTHRCEDYDTNVNLDDCSIDLKKGDPEIKTFWKDPEFKKDQNTFYYARVLENPTCRWSTWDAIRAGEKPRQDIPVTIQERAWSSPIWLSGS